MLPAAAAAGGAAGVRWAPENTFFDTEMSQDVKNGETCKVPRLRCCLKNHGFAAVSAHSPFPQRPAAHQWAADGAGRARPGRGRGASPEPAGPLPEGRSGLRGGAGRGGAVRWAEPAGSPRTAPPLCSRGIPLTRVTASGGAGMDTQPAMSPRADTSLLGITPRAKITGGCTAYLFCPTQTSGRRCRAYGALFAYP